MSVNNSPQEQNCFASSVPPEDRYFCAREIAELTNLSVKSLEKRRAKGDGPPFYKIGRLVRYRFDQVRAWIEAGGAV